MKPRRPRHRRILALASAVGAHLLALLALGWRVPKAPPGLPPDTLPPVEVQLLRPTPTAPSASASSASIRARPIPTRPASPQALAPVPAPAPQASALAMGPADCAPEDLPLLTEAEKARCRNQLGADQERRLARGADDRAARQVAEAERGPRTFRMPSEKEAYYAAVAHTYWELSSNGPRGAGHLPGVGCAPVSVPLLGGIEVNKNVFAKKKDIRPPHSLKLGPLPCYLVPPKGMLTEESDLDPLAPQWRPKP